MVLKLGTFESEPWSLISGI